MNNLILNVGNIIKSHRKAKGLSTQDLASLLHVSAGLINNIENSKTDCFNLELLYSISNILEVPVTDIISYNIDNIFDEVSPNVEFSPSIKLQIAQLIKSLITISNNPNWNPEKLSLLIQKLNNDITFLNKISSF